MNGQGPGAIPSGRLSAVVLALDSATAGDGVWQSGTLSAGGIRVRFVATGVRSLPTGALVDVLGVPERHPQYGPQVRIVECYRVRPPTSADALELFLAANVEGLGAARSRKLVALLGIDAVGRIRENPALLEQVFPGKVGRGLVHAWNISQRRWAEADRVADMTVRLLSAGVTYGLARKVVSYFRSAEVAEIVLGRHPYRLLDVPGFAWKRADGIARKIGVGESDPERLSMAAVHAAETASAEGHSCLPAAELSGRAGHLLGSPSLGAHGVRIATDDTALIADGDLIYLPRALEAEWTVANRLRRHVAGRTALSDVQRQRVESALAGSSLTMAQHDAVRGALAHGVFTLTGGPGTGKTTTVRTVVHAAQALGLHVTIVAPTGKAAARASQVTGAPAGTVHRIIGCAPGNVREGGPLDTDLLIVDETSMASVEMLAWLLSNLRASTRILLCGDPDQLPSVDHGAVLRDVLSAGWIPGVRLVEVHRQASGSAIVANAYRVLAGEALQPDRDEFVAVNLSRATADARGPNAGFAWTRLLGAINWLRAHQVDATSGIQVLSPMKRGPLGTTQLNAALQSHLNPNGTQGPHIGHGSRVRVGDRVIQVRNDYTLGDTGVFNGEQGVVVSVSRNRAVVRFDGDREVAVSDFRLANLQLAWATTIHRSQGSEWPAVVTLFHSSHGRMLSRELLYTAITRAKSRFVLIGDEPAFRSLRTPVSEVRGVRHTGLARHLRKRAAVATAPTPSASE